MSETSLFYYNDQLGKVAPRITRLFYDITGAKASTATIPNTAVLTAYDAIASQAVIDTFLGTTNEFLVAAFDSTSMGTDAFAAIVNFNGQVKKLLGVTVVTRTGTAGATSTSNSLAASATLTSSSLTAQCALGANGNVAVRSIVTGMDGFTSGQIMVDIYWIAK